MTEQEIQDTIELHENETLDLSGIELIQRGRTVGEQKDLLPVEERRATLEQLRNATYEKLEFALIKGTGCRLTRQEVAMLVLQRDDQGGE